MKHFLTKFINLFLKQTDSFTCLEKSRLQEIKHVFTTFID